MNEGINLLEPNKNSSPVGFVRHIQKMRIFVISLLFLVSVFSVILFILVTLSPLPALQRQEEELQQNLLQSKSDITKLALLNERTTAIQSVLNKRASLDQTIGLIEDKLPQDTTFTAIQGDNKSMTITVESTSLQSLDTFMNGIVGYIAARKAFTKITLLDLTNDQTTDEYSATIQLYMM
jgi:Tfp pilus assembly protein PilN